jgi:HlyD family secretion protein
MAPACGGIATQPEADQFFTAADMRRCIILSKVATMASPTAPPVSIPSRIRAHGTAALLVLAAIVLVLGGAALAGWLRPSSPTNILLVSGDIEAHESLLSFKTVQSRIVQLPFDEGATVKASTILARADDTDYRQQVTIAEAALEVQSRQLASTQQTVAATKQTITNDYADLSEKTVDAGRQQSLWQQQATSMQLRDLALTAQKQSAATLARDQALVKVAERNVDLAAAGIKNAQASLDMAKIVLGYTVLRAPFTGVVLVRQAELGESVVPGSPVVTLADLDHVWLRAYINEPDISKVRLGQAVTITTDSYPGKIYHGRVSFIASQAEFTPKSVESNAERVTLVYRLKIDLENPDHELVPGLPADAHITLAPPGAA